MGSSKDCSKALEYFFRYSSKYVFFIIEQIDISTKESLSSKLWGAGFSRKYLTVCYASAKSNDRVDNPGKEIPERGFSLLENPISRY